MNWTDLLAGALLGLGLGAGIAARFVRTIEIRCLACQQREEETQELERMYHARDHR